MVPVARQPVKDTSRHRITDGHGSSALQGLYRKRVAQRTDREASATSKRHKAEERASNKAAEDAEKVAQLALWRLCQPACSCGATTCPVNSLVLCLYCNELKTRACGVAKCKAAAAADAADDEEPESPPNSETEEEEDDDEEEEEAASALIPFPPAPFEEEEEEDDVCMLCHLTTLNRKGGALGDVLICEDCNGEVHLRCSSLRTMPLDEEPYFCERCNNGPTYPTTTTTTAAAAAAAAATAAAATAAAAAPPTTRATRAATRATRASVKASAAAAAAATTTTTTTARAAAGALLLLLQQQQEEDEQQQQQQSSESDNEDNGCEFLWSYYRGKLLSTTKSLANVPDYAKLLRTVATNNKRKHYSILGNGHCGATALGVQIRDCDGFLSHSGVAAATLMRGGMSEAMCEVDNYGSLEPLITELMIVPGETIPSSTMKKKVRAAALAVILERRAQMHADVNCSATTMDEATWCGSLDFKAAALRFGVLVYVATPWGAVEIHSPERNVKVVTEHLSTSTVIPSKALVVFLTTDRDHYEALIGSDDSNIDDAEPNEEVRFLLVQR
jgi:hypothetical protein